MAAPKNPHSVGPKSDKLWTDALRLAVKRVVDEKDDPRTYLTKMAEAIAIKGAEGDVAAVNHIADRLEGKPAQVSVIEGGERAVQVTFEMNIERDPIEPPRPMKVISGEDED